jgi:hypothetical protein
MYGSDLAQLHLPLTKRRGDMSQERDQTELAWDGDQPGTRHNRWARRAAIFAPLVAGILAITATPALAKEWQSDMDDVRVNFDSRTWDHNGETKVIITLKWCSTNPVHPSGPASANTDLELRRQTPWYMPDQGHGVKQFYCANSAVQTWTGLPSDPIYYFRVNKINGSTSSSNTLDVNFVKVEYTT